MIGCDALPAKVLQAVEYFVEPRWLDKTADRPSRLVLRKLITGEWRLADRFVIALNEVLRRTPCPVSTFIAGARLHSRGCPSWTHWGRQLPSTCVMAGTHVAVLLPDLAGSA